MAWIAAALEHGQKAHGQRAAEGAGDWLGFHQD